MEIRLKNGMPLMLPGGVVAGSQACCCENPPPPPPCFCGDYCPYIIEITAPSEVAVRSPPGECDGGTDFASADDDSWLVWMVAPPGGLGLSVGTMTGYAPQSTNWSAQNNVLVAGLAAGVQVEADYTDGDPWDPTITRVEISVGLSFYCEQEPGGAYATRPVVIAGIDVHIKQWRSGQWAPFLGLSAAGVTKSITFYPPTECQYTNERSCGYSIVGPGPANARYIQTPLTLDVSGSTTSQGAWGQSGSATVGSLGTTLLGWADDIVDAISATFRITSRDNCLPVVDCDCESNTDGLKILFSEQPFFSFFLFDGDTELQTFSDLGAYYTLFYQPSANDWVITYEQNNPSNTELYYRITARIFCEAVPGGVPSPFRWYYSLESECFEWEDGSITKNTKETWVGHFNCEEDPCGTNGRAAGDLYPVGRPRDVVSLGRTTPEGYAACNPSGGIRELRIINDAECP